MRSKLGPLCLCGDAVHRSPLADRVWHGLAWKSSMAKPPEWGQGGHDEVAGGYPVIVVQKGQDMGAR